LSEPLVRLTDSSVACDLVESACDAVEFVGSDEAAGNAEAAGEAGTGKAEAARGAGAESSSANEMPTSAAGKATVASNRRIPRISTPRLNARL
jgi:hypothetical protein